MISTQLSVFEQEHGYVGDPEIGERNEPVIPFGDLDRVAIGEVLFDQTGKAGSPLVSLSLTASTRRKPKP